MSKSNLVQFKLNDVVQIGSAGRRGKIVDIVRPLGTYEMYKVMLFDDGSVHSAARHELVKGLPDDLISFDNIDLLFDDFYDQETSKNQTSSEMSVNPHHSSDKNTVYQSNATANVPISQCSDNVATSSNVIPVINAPPATSSTATMYSPKTIKNRFPEMSNSTADYVRIHENNATARKTAGHQKLIENFLKCKRESRQIHEIPPSDLDKYLSEFFMRLRQRDGSNYELTTLKGM